MATDSHTVDHHVIEAFGHMGSSAPGIEATALGRAIEDRAWRDATALLRDAMLQHPQTSWWAMPTAEVDAMDAYLADHGIEAQTTQGAIRVLRANPWRPDWVPGGVDGVGSAAHARLVRRPDESVPGDRFLTAVDSAIDRYRTPGQREAIRAALFLPEGETLLVGLPTGAGKTLVALAPAFLQAGRGATVIVVPTTSLALDHERRLQELHPNIGAVAYRGEDADFTGEVRSEFRRRLRSGEQRIVVTSPEALHESLAVVIEDLASLGRLHQLVIDEAHIVGEWGDDFRPEFQGLAGLRRRWISLARAASRPALRTVLLTGTLTDATVQLLSTLFAEGRLHQVIAAALRPEPEVYFATDLEPAARVGCVLEAVHRLPRPLVVFTTRRTTDRTAQQLATGDVLELLRSVGYRRLALVDGSTRPAERRRVVEGLIDADGASIDVVVANSAFGLGVDVPGIRSVVHACVPESIDRWYQEVGRAGRDGRATVGLLAATAADWEQARSMSDKTQLRAETALERWTVMERLSEPSTTAGVRLVPLSAKREGVEKDSEVNRKWNRRTLLMLSLSGLLRVEAPELVRPELGPDATEDDLQRAWNDAFHVWERRATVRMLRTGVDPSQLLAELQRVRDRLSSTGSDSLDALRMVTEGHQCAASVLQEAYAVLAEDGFRSRPGRACGGCPACRASGRPAVADPTPQPPPIRYGPPGKAFSLPLAGSTPLRFIWCDLDDRRSLTDLAEVLIRSGIRIVIDPKGLLRERRIVDAGRRTEDGVVFVAERLDRSLPYLPALVVGSGDREIREAVEQQQFPVLVLLARGDEVDPHRPDLRRDEYRSPAVTLAAARKELL